GGADVGACPGRARGASRAVHRGRPAPRSGGSRAAMPGGGAGPPHNHEEGTLSEETPITPGRVGAPLSGNAGVLALSRAVEKNRFLSVIRTKSVANFSAWSPVFACRSSAYRFSAAWMRFSSAG